MTTTSETAPALKCRYRLATGCDAEFGSRPGLNAHERNAHAAHSVELRVCPACGADCGNEMERARHLSNEHGARAGSEARQEMDARQVLDLLGPRTDGPAAVIAAAGPEPESAAGTEPESAAGTEPEPEAAVAAPDLLSAARDVLDALAGEVEALRAENASLKAANAELTAEAATFAKVRTLLAGQNGTREHAAANVTGGA